MVENVSTNAQKAQMTRPRVLGRVLQVTGPVVAVGLTVWSAIVAKELGAKPPLLASVGRGAFQETMSPPAAPVSFETGSQSPTTGIPEGFEPEAIEPSLTPARAQELDSATRALASDPAVRWFDGRPVRPARIMTMVVTAYSPDEKSCGNYADGVTATLHSVATNGFALVAADPALLRYGSMLTVPGYDQERIVPVLDCGAAIKGRRLDVIFPTDAQARKWGRKTLKVVVWEYADGKPAPNPRRLR